MNPPARLTRSLLAGAVVGTAIVGLASANGAAAASPEAVPALSWLADELDSTADGIFVYDSGFGDFTDYGLTLDAVLALALGGGHGDTLDRSMDAIEGSIAEYISHPDLGDGNGAGKYAGSASKALLTEQVAGRPTTIGSVVLETEVRSAIRGATPTARWTGRVDADHGDFSNGVTQSLAVLALSRTSGGVPAAVRDFLLEQQCPGGGFRISFDKVNPDFTIDEAGSTRGCTAAADGDLDSTAFALQALLSIRNDTGVSAAIANAIAFLTAPANAATNANSAGLFGQALRAAGETAAADANAAKVKALQLTAAGPDVGAIVFDADAKAAAPGSAIAPADLSQAWRATAQGVLALELPSYGPVVAPPTTTSTTGPTTTSTTAASTTSTSAAAATTSTTAKAAATSGTIPKTGSSTHDEVSIGLFLVGLGLAAVGQSRLRGRGSS